MLAAPALASKLFGFSQGQRDIPSLERQNDESRSHRREKKDECDAPAVYSHLYAVFMLPLLFRADYHHRSPECK